MFVPCESTLNIMCISPHSSRGCFVLLLIAFLASLPGHSNFYKQRPDMLLAAMYPDLCRGTETFIHEYPVQYTKGHGLDGDR